MRHMPVVSFTIAFVVRPLRTRTEREAHRLWQVQCSTMQEADMRWTSGSSCLAALCAMLGLLFLSGPVSAQETGTITGIVRAEGTQRLLSSAQIQVLGTPRGGLSDENGRFVIAGVPAGQYTLRATLLGFSRTDVTVTVTAGQTATADFTLAQSAIELSEIVVTGTSGGAAEARARQLDRQDQRRRPARRGADQQTPTSCSRRARPV
jgi:hypothetical protein